VDASGQSSRAPQWLTELGAAPPAEERIDTGLAYATRVYRATPDLRTHDYKGIYLVPHPLLPRGGVVMPTEEPDRYLVMLSGLAGDQPPTGPDGFEAFAGTLEHPIVSEWMAGAQAQGPPVGYRNTANVRRRYDLLDGPDGLLVIGDAACVFNPIYGQGISVAALEAAALRDALAAGHPTTRQLQTRVMAAAEQAWAISAGADKSMPGATGDALRSGLADRLAGWYLGRVQAHSATNETVGNAFSGVVHLTSPPTVLFAWPVVRIALFRRPQPGAAEPPLFAEPPPARNA
jgi:flavin-dependent dehydrogenase